MNVTKELQKIDKRLTEARQALRAVDDEERKAKGELQDASAALSAHYAQERVDELEPADLHNALAKAPQPRRAALEPASRR